MVAFALSCFGILLYLWLAFGGPTPLAPKGYRFSTSFGEATQLAAEADVRISGVPVGKVKSISSTPQGRTRTVIELDRKYAPIPRDTRAILRQKTLLGETYVELTPGHRSSGMLPEGGSLPAGQVSDTVEFDEVLRTFDQPTREAFQTWLQAQAQGLKGQGKNLNDALGNLAPFATDTTTLLKLLNAQSDDVRQIVSGTGTVFDALSARDDQLAQLIANADSVFSTTGRQNADLQAIFKALPTFERESTTTVKRLTKFAQDTDPLVTQLRPFARELSPTLQQLQGLAPDLNAFFRDLDPLIDASEKGLPAVQSFVDQLAPFLGEFDAPLAQLNPILSFVGEYPREINAFFANVVAATQASAPSGDSPPIHYLRTMNPITPENLAVYPRRLPTSRTNPYAHPNAFDDLAQGMASYETRQCVAGRTLPVFATADNLLAAIGGASNALTPLLPPAVSGLDADQAQRLVQILDSYVAPGLQLDLLTNVLGGSAVTGLLGDIAPPCRQSPDFTTRAGTSQYPHISAAPNGHTPGA